MSLYRKKIFIASKAIFTNIIAMCFPSLYEKMHKETGRGKKTFDSDVTAKYFLKCFFEYFDTINISHTRISNFLKGKNVLEYGPGDILGIPLLMYAYGADYVCCVDKFSLFKKTAEYENVYKYILDSLNEDQKLRAKDAFIVYGDVRSGFDKNKINYIVKKNGFINEKNLFDFIISRAVLEHVNNLEMTFNDIYESLKKYGLSVHLVDLKSHNLDLEYDLDFLTWHPFLYNIMYNQKGYPNRFRINKYEEEIQKNGFYNPILFPTEKLDEQCIDTIRHKFAKPFRDLSSEELSWLGFWMVLSKSDVDIEATFVNQV